MTLAAALLSNAEKVIVHVQQHFYDRSVVIKCGIDKPTRGGPEKCHASKSQQEILDAADPLHI